MTGGDSLLTTNDTLPQERRGAAGEVLWAALRLGVSSFGGPIAHLGYFRQEYVVRRRWLDEQTYADLVALCQFLSGPASSQVGIAVGTLRAGLLGGLAAWLGFTLPSAIALTAFAYGVGHFAVADMGWLHGLKVVAVAVVAQAVWGMARQFSADRRRAALTILAAIAMLLAPTAIVQVLTILVAGILGWWVLSAEASAPAVPHRVALGQRFAVGCLIVFVLLLVGAPLLAIAAPASALPLFDRFYRAGALVFGGGHVVLPLLRAAVVPPGWLTDAQFVAGYGAAQAVPGPLFTFSAYLGAIRSPAPNGLVGAMIALVAIFLPAFLLVWGARPEGERVRGHPGFQRALGGINAAVVGILLAALYSPVWTSAILSAPDVALALAGFGLLAVWKAPPWLVVMISAQGGALLSALA